MMAIIGLEALAVAAPVASPEAQAQQARQKPAAKSEDRKAAKKPRQYQLGTLTLSSIWTHQSASRNGAAFLKINNAGEEDDALIDASTPVAKRIELHGPAEGGEVWQTSRVDEIPMPQKAATTLTGTGLHLKLIGLRGALKAGEIIPITLTFERAGAITVQAEVLSPNDAAEMIERSKPKEAKPAKKPAPKRNQRRRRRQ